MKQPAELTPQQRAWGAFYAELLASAERLKKLMAELENKKAVPMGTATTK